MTSEYAEPDREVVDYELWLLDPELRDRESGQPLLLRGPRPDLAPGRYFACLGAAQTFGRFCPAPFPSLLAASLGLGALNLGRGGAGPGFFADEGERLLDYVNGARFAVVQVMSGRSASNSLFHSRGLGSYLRVSDGARIGCDEAFRQLLAEHDLEQVRKVVEETRQDWIASYRRLLRRIRVPRVLLWFAMRPPEYGEGYGDLQQLFGEFPQLVNRAMLEEIRADCDACVEFVSRRGIPHRLRSRLSGKPVEVRDPWGGVWAEDWYYGSPEMHADAARALERACAPFARPG